MSSFPSIRSRAKSPAFALTVPLFAVIFGAVIVGVLVGGMVVSFGKLRWRFAARRAERENARLKAEVEQRNEADFQASARTPAVPARRICPVWVATKRLIRRVSAAFRGGGHRVGPMPSSSMFEVKICGINEPRAMDAALDAGADLVGLVFFAASPRAVSHANAARLAARARGRALVVALVVDADDTLLSRIVTEVSPDILQLHGAETRRASPKSASVSRAR